MGGKASLQAQQKKLQGEVEQLKLKVADATNKYNILPNAVLKVFNFILFIYFIY